MSQLSERVEALRAPLRFAADDYAAFARFCRSADEAEARELSLVAR